MHVTNTHSLANQSKDCLFDQSNEELKPSAPGRFPRLLVTSSDWLVTPFPAIMIDSDWFQFYAREACYVRWYTGLLSVKIHNTVNRSITTKDSLSSGPVNIILGGVEHR